MRLQLICMLIVVLVGFVGGPVGAQAIIDVSPALATTSDQVKIAVADEGACVHYALSGPTVDGNVITIAAVSIVCPPLPPPGVLNFQFAVGPLAAGSYEVHLQVDGTLVDSRAFAVMAPVTSLTLAVGRFAVGLSWIKPDGTPGGSATAVQTSDDCGYFWLFDSADVEVVVKIVDGGLVNGKVWVFASSLTGQPFTLTVTDQIGTFEAPCSVVQPPAPCVQTYTSGGGALQSLVDFSAFSSND